MSWDQIKEVSREKFTHIGNHSHTHGYLIDETPDTIKDDLIKSKKFLKKTWEKIHLFFISVW